MNILLLHPEDFISANRVRISGRRFDHLTNIVKVQTGDPISLGRINGNLGQGTVITVETHVMDIEINTLDIEPPATLPLTLVLGLPRPRMLQRTLQNIATLGVEKLILLQTARVEKSFWQTPLLQESKIKEQLVLGLEQGKATQLPTVAMFQRFRPFVEDQLESLLGKQSGLIAHPGEYPMAQCVQQQATVLAIGPEGGFLPQEVDTFIHRGFQAIQLGQRILRVETAVPFLIGKLF